MRWKRRNSVQEEKPESEDESSNVCLPHESVCRYLLTYLHVDTGNPHRRHVRSIPSLLENE